MVAASYRLLVDWSGDGTFTGTGEDVTGDAFVVECSRGRERPLSLPGLGFASAGRLTATLDNSAGTYSPSNAGSPIAGLILPGRRVRLEATYSATTYVLWTGYLDRVLPQASGKGKATAQLVASGPMIKLAATPLQAMTAIIGNRSDQIITAILTLAGLSGSLATGRLSINQWYAGRGTKALDAIRAVEASELGFFYEDPASELTFEDRLYRVTQARSLASQATYSDASGASLPYHVVSELDPLEQILNRVSIPVTPYTLQASATLWTLSGSVQVAPGETLVLWATYPAEGDASGAYVYDWSPPAITSSGGSLLVSVLEYAQSARISLANTDPASTTTITALSIAGVAVTRGTAANVVGEDTASQSTYGLREYTLPSPWIQSAAEARGYADFIVNRYANPAPAFTIALAANRSGALMLEALTRRISDRVTLTATHAAQLGFDGDCFVESIAHTIRHQTEHTVTLGLSVAGTDTYWIVGTGALGDSAGVTATRLAY